MIKASKSRQSHQVLKFSFIVLPYLSYLGLVGLVGAIILTLVRQGRQVFQSQVAQGLILIAVGLVINASLAFYKGEAFLQLANFIPFFLLFAVLITVLKTVEQLQDLAWSLVVTSIPVNVMAVIEFGLKFPTVKAALSDWSILGWFYRHDYGHRANSFFGHPNTYASYLTILLGLSVGLALQQLVSRSTSAAIAAVPQLRQPRFSVIWLYTAIALIWLGIACAGSRNGLFIALSQLIVLIMLGYQYRTLVLTGVGGLLLLLVSALTLGVGDRDVTWNSLIQGIQNDPRISVWQIALDLTAERPWLGWGLGNYKLLYPPRSVRPDYPYVSHAHNFWLLMTSEAGIILTIAITLLIGYICYRGMRVFILRQLDPFSQAIMTGYLMALWGIVLFSMLDLPFYDARINALNWFILAGIYILSHYSPKIRAIEAAEADADPSSGPPST